MSVSTGYALVRGAIPNKGYRRRGWAAVVLAGVLASFLVVATGCGPDDEARPGPEGPTPEVPDLTRADLWLSFDDHPVGAVDATRFSDATGGRSVGLVVTSFGGTVEVVDGPPGRGSAVAFPEVCADPSSCPRSMVEVALTPALDPGDRDFEFGATVWLAPDQTSIGSNIVQQGRFGSEGGQWKLQVDGAAGEPSCVVRGSESTEPLVARSSVSIADSEWHRVSCRRDAQGVSIEVDGEVAREEGVTGSVVNDAPMRIGAPGVAKDDDQFHGLIDDVYLLSDPAA